MGRYGDPVTWLEAGDGQLDEQSDAEPEDALVVGGDVEPVGQLPQIEYEDISDAEDAPAQAHAQYDNIANAEQAPHVQFEDISEPEDVPDDTPVTFDVDGVVFEFLDDWPWDTFVEGQSTTYIVDRDGEPPRLYTLYNWDLTSGSWALWYQYLRASEALYGESGRNQFALHYLNIHGDINIFGRVVKEFDRRFVRCD